MPSQAASQEPLTTRRAHRRWTRAALLVTLLLGIPLTWRLAGARADDPETAVPTHTNRLIDESSPYLLLHAHNPVDWYPWGEEAFARARRENKPIFLSVGYATCYWCHVMERESFDNEEIAAALNRRFICVKVDREERPDVDEIYMTAVQLLTGQGGWPMSVWLTPDLKPFYGGTYYPPRDAYGRPGFPTLIERIGVAWDEQREGILEQADQVAQAVREWAHARAEERVPWTDELAREAVGTILSREDKTNGGNLGAPKFPPDMNCQLLLAVWRDTHEDKDLDYVTRALDGMALGGIYDHLGGGFHRYSVDEHWTVPHFEKMLYNQALLVPLYADAAVVTNRALYRRVVDETIAFVEREMSDPETGAFYSALDAETEAEEGRSYVWTVAEVDQLLGDEAELFRQIYGLDGPANFEDERYVLRLSKPLAETAAEMKISEDELVQRLRPLREKLLAARARRPQPLTDDKVLTSWNALMISALAHAGQVLERPEWIERAAKVATFLLKNLRDQDGALLRVYRAGKSKQTAFLDDYAFLAAALLDLYEATGQEAWLASAAELADEMIAAFADEEAGGFFYTRADQPDLFVRSKNPQDGAIPSGNSVAAGVLLRLAELRGDAELRRRGTATIEAFTGLARRAPGAFANLLLVGHKYAAGAASPTVASRPSVTGSARHVKLTARVVEPAGATATIEAILKIDEGWHVNAREVGDATLIPTSVKVAGPDGMVVEGIDYPTGETFQAGGGPAIRVYQGQVVIPVRVRGVEGGKVSITARVQACSDRACLQPSELTAEVSVAAVPR